MRTTQRDQGAFVTVSTRIVDAASGVGILTGGGMAIPFAWTRTGTGIYVLNFDTSFTPYAVVITPDGSGFTYPRSTSLFAGTLTVAIYNTSTPTAPINSGFGLVVTLRATR